MAKALELHQAYSAFSTFFRPWSCFIKAPSPSGTPHWDRLYLIIGLGVALSAMMAAFCFYEFSLSKHSATLTKSLTAYCGLYRCTETVEGAGRMLLKIYPRSFSFIELQNESDDPATGKEASPNITVQYLKVEDAVARMDGIEQTTTKTIFTTTGDSSNKPSQTGSFTSEDNFTLEWHKGNDGGPDTVILTILEPPSVFGSHNEEQSVLHFARIQ